MSGFRVNHSTNTAPIRVFNDTKINIDNHRVPISVLPDLSAVFDMMDNAILLQRAEHHLGPKGTVLD